MNKLDFKNLVVKEILYISGDDCVMALEESKSFKRRYELDSDVEYRVITNQGVLQVVLKKGVTKEQLANRIKDVFQDSGVEVWDCDFV